MNFVTNLQFLSVAHHLFRIEAEEVTVGQHTIQMNIATAVAVPVVEDVGETATNKNINSNNGKIPKALKKHDVLF